MKVHERLKAYRIKMGYTQKSKAIDAGIAPQRLSAIERGAIKLTADEFENICVFGYKVNPSIFFNYEVSETENSQFKL